MATYAERILDSLWSMAPDGATNGELARHLGIRSQQTVYMLTQQLMRTGRIHGERLGATWVFHAAEEPGTTLAVGPTWASDARPAARFEALARRVLAVHYAVAFSAAAMPGVRKRFDFVSPDRQVVGDAKYFTRVGGVRLPPASSRLLLNTSGFWRRPTPQVHFSCSAMTARSRSGGSNATASWLQA